jgi:hypothetical protein
MPKWVKMIVGVMLLPLCAGVAQVLWRMLLHSTTADQVWAPLLCGAACWLVIFLLLPKPMWVYVFGHELTHAAWTWLFGGEVKKFKASSKGGHVIVTKNNFLISLAPYFFPFYAILVVAVFLIGDLVWNWHQYRVWFHLMLGAAYAFHLTLTLHVLRTAQSDIVDEGRLFSIVIIFLGNAVFLLVALPLLVGSGHLLDVFRDVLTATAGVLGRLARLF